MIDQDIMYRAGLMLAILVLAGLFGSSLGGMIEEDEVREITRISRELGNLLKLFHQQDRGSSLVISFGSSMDGPDHPVSFPGDIRGEPYRIDFLPGSVHLSFGGRQKMVAIGSWLVPSFSPAGISGMNSSTVRRTSTLSGGYSVTTPVILELDRPAGMPGGEVFIHPSGEPDSDYREGMIELGSLIDTEGQLLPGWKMEASLRSRDIIHLEPPVLLLRTNIPAVIEGSCPRPFLLPPGMTGRSFEEMPPDGAVNFYKSARMHGDGTIVIEMGFYPSL